MKHIIVFNHKHIIHFALCSAYIRLDLESNQFIINIHNTMFKKQILQFTVPPTVF